MTRELGLAQAVAALALLLTTASHASITVNANPPVTPPSGGWVVGGNNVTIEYPGLPNGPGYQTFEIIHNWSGFPGDPDETLGVVSVKNTAPDTVIVLLVQSNTDVHSVIRDQASVGEVWIASVIANDLGSYADEVRSGAFTGNRINLLRAHRSIWGDVTALGSAIETSAKDIVRVWVQGDNQQFQSDGALRGNVRANGGFAASKGIGSVEVKHIIATPDPQGMVIESGANINSIVCGQLGNVAITATGHDVLELSARTGGWGGDPAIPIGFPVDEEFNEGTADLTPSGSLTCARLWSFDTLRDVRANITNTVAPHADLTWKIGRSFTGGGQINLPPQGLTHQIIVNERNNPTGMWTSSAHVNLDGISLSNEPSYTNPATGSSGVGGGSAGLATFDVHHEACSPAESSSTLGYGPHYTCLGEEDCCERFKKAYVRMYGPITQIQSPAVTVEYRPAGSSSSFTGVAWTVVTAVSSTDPRVLEVSRSGNLGWAPGDNYEYRIKPITGVLKSDEVDGSPNVVAFEYKFTLTSDCGSEQGFTSGGFDMNNDGRMTSADLVAWSASARDLNGDGQANAADLARLIRIVARFSN